MTTDDLARRYDIARTEGARCIQQRWYFLNASTRSALVHSGFYSHDGQRQQDEQLSTEDPRADVERLEYALGVLKQCVAARIPVRSEKDVPIPVDALTDDVLTSCEELLFVPAWHDPEFLRLALAAVSAHQEANALTMVGPKSENRSAVMVAVGRLLKLCLMALMPAALASGLAAAARSDVGGAGLAFYMLGAGVLAALSVKNQNNGNNISTFERAHLRWVQYRYLRASGVVGCGARFNLERMAQDGVMVPSIAFDLCAVLEAQMKAIAIDSPLDRTSRK